MTDIYVVRVESVRGAEATFRVATLQGGTSYAGALDELYHSTDGVAWQPVPLERPKGSTRIAT